MKKFRNQLKNKEGFTLIELAIVIAIIATLLAGLRIVPGILANNRANAEISIIPKITASIQSHYFNKANYAGLTNTIINSYKMVPDSWNQGAAVISNRWAGAVTFAPATTTTANDSFSMLYSQVPTAECLAIVSGVADNFLKVTVGSTVVKAVGGTVNDTTLATACSATPPVNLTFVASK